MNVCVPHLSLRDVEVCSILFLPSLPSLPFLHLLHHSFHHSLFGLREAHIDVCVSAAQMAVAHDCASDTTFVGSCYGPGIAATTSAFGLRNTRGTSDAVVEWRVVAVCMRAPEVVAYLMQRHDQIPIRCRRSALSFPLPENSADTTIAVALRAHGSLSSKASLAGAGEQMGNIEANSGCSLVAVEFLGETSQDGHHT